jgi:uncharacterized protein
MSLSSFPFSEAELDNLESILFDADLQQESFDPFGLHGMISSFVIGPGSIPQTDWISHILGDTGGLLASDKRALLENSLTTLAQHILNQVNVEQEIRLPEEIFTDEIALRNWCIGFVEGFLLNEDAWFIDQDEATVAILMLPVMTHSGLFEDEYFREFKKQDQLMAKMVNELPENLLDLYLLYQI